MNLMSSMANTLVGSVIAIVSVAPDRESGMIWYLLRGLGRDQLDDRRVDLELVEVDGGDAVLLAEQRGDLVVLDEAELDQNQAELPPVGLLVGQRFLELLGVMRFSLRSSSPIRTAMVRCESNPCSRRLRS